jgi:hypothetical protein
MEAEAKAEAEADESEDAQDPDRGKEDDLESELGWRGERDV